MAHAPQAPGPFAGTTANAALDALFAELFDEGDGPQSALEDAIEWNCSADLAPGPLPAVPGLRFYHRLLPVTEQQRFLRLIDAQGDGWLTTGAGSDQNQAMHFGTLPGWATQLAALLPPACMPPEVRSPVGVQSAWQRAPGRTWSIHLPGAPRVRLLALQACQAGLPPPTGRPRSPAAAAALAAV